MSAPPRRILVIALRRLGDVLLATALIRSIRRAWPDARLEVLIEAGTAGMLEGNPDIDAVHILPPRGRTRSSWQLLCRLWRRFDLAVSLHASDRPHLWALAAASRRVGVVPPDGLPGARWKRWSCAAWTELQLGGVHTVEQCLRLADAMGIARVSEVVAPCASLRGEPPGQPYAVLHPAPMYAYKEWSIAGWQALIVHLLSRGLGVVLSCGPGERDRGLVARICDGLPESCRDALVVLGGDGSLGQLAALLRGAGLYVGTDTSVTHLAAAAGVPTIALFGPSPTTEWGPWPAVQWHGRASSPWLEKVPLQQRGNVWLLQGEGDCVPCLKEGCDRHRASRSRCLDELPAQRVTRAVDEVLASRQG